MDLLKIDYQNSLPNLASRIMQKYGIKSHYKPLDGLPDLEKYNHIILLLLDGMGVKNINDHLDEKSFIKRNIVRSFQSTFPPTTVAATNALLSGYAPGVTGWLGWHQYFPAEDVDLILFENTGYYNNSFYPDFNSKLAYDYFFKDFPCSTKMFYPRMIDKVDGSTSLNEMCERIISHTKEKKTSFSYGYWAYPDLLMHEYGTKDICIKKCLTDIDMDLFNLSQNISDDTCIIITADHGHVDVMPIDIYDYPHITKYFRQKPSLEGRAMTFYVSDVEAFKDAFNQEFHDYFILFNRKTFLSQMLVFYDIQKVFIGDYVAVATDKFYFRVKNDHFRGHHAGLTIEEMEIPLIYYRR